MKKKLLVVAHRWPPRYGGLQNIAYLYAEKLTKYFEVSIFTSKERNVKNMCPKKCKLIEGGASMFLYKTLGVPFPLFSYYALKKLKRAVKESDYVFIHDRYYLSSYFASKYAQVYKKKIILMLHTPILKYSFPKSLLYYFLNLISKKAVKNSNLVISVSKDTEKNVLNYYDLNNVKKVIYNPVNLKDFGRISDDKKEFNVLWVGRFVEKKGVFLLPKIAKILAKKKITLNVIGDGPLFEKIKKESLGISNLKLLGKISDRKKILNFYKNSSVYLVTSLHGEAFPLVIGDALASGLSVVSTKGGTYVEIFENNLGYLCDTYNPKEISEKIMLLKDDSATLKKFSRNALNFARKNLDLNKNVSQLTEAILND